MTVSVELDAKPMATLLFRGSRLRGFLSAAGSELVRLSQRSFVEQGFNGRPWLARSVPNLPGVIRDLEVGPNIQPKRFESRPALVDSGRLSTSANYRITGQTGIELYSNVSYAGLHQNGGPWEMRISPTVKKNLRNLMARTRGEVSGPIQENRGILRSLLARSSISGEVPPRPFMGLPDTVTGVFQMMMLRHLTSETAQT